MTKNRNKKIGHGGQGRPFDGSVEPRPGWRGVAIAVVLLGLGVFLLYARTIPGGFIYDDEFYVRDNPAIRDLGNLPRFFSDPDTASGDRRQAHSIYRPLTTLFFAAETSVFGPENPGWFHAVSLALFATLIGLVFLFERRLFGGDTRPATMASALFAVHPLDTETAGWISSQSTLLCAVFMIAGLHVYVRARDLPDKKRRLAAVGSFLLLAVSMMTKEIGLMSPLLLPLLDRLAPGDGKSRAGRATFIAALAAAGALFLIRWHMIGGIAQRGLFGENLPEHFAAMAAVVPRYFQRALAPVDLRVFYDMPSLAPLPILLGLALFFGLPVAAFFARRKYPVAAFGLAFGFVTYLPSSNIFPTGMPTAERYFFLPLLGLALAAADFARPLLRGPKARFAIAALAVIGVAFAASTFQRTFVWSSPLRFWRQAIVEQPRLSLGYYNLAVIESRNGDAAAAEQHYRKALEINPRDGLAANNLAALLVTAGRVNEGEHYLRLAIEIRPADPHANRNLVRILLDQGKQDAAVAALRDYLAADPRAASAFARSEALANLDAGHQAQLQSLLH